MGAYNPDISNGTCYYYDGYEADSRYIPCGNAALGPKVCCESLDMCLSSGACYNAQYGVTYLAGCTIETYDDPICPKKTFEDEQWVGLVYCNGTSNEWVACDEKETGSTTVTKPSYCWCPDEDSRTVAFSDSSVLKNIMSLPATKGQTVTWKDADTWSTEHSIASAFGFSLDPDTTTSTSSPTSSSSTNSASTSFTPASTSQGPSATLNPISTFAAPAATSAPPATSSGLSTGAKVGVALGSVGGTAVLAVLAWLIFACMRRRSQKDEAKAEEPPPMREPTLPQVERRTTDPDWRSPAWSGHKSELPADESVTSMSASPAPVYHEYAYPPRPASTVRSEVEGSPVRASPVRPTHDGGLRLPGQNGTFYEMAG
ncbi:hypothetical protein A1O7_06700 [Cladophialophora yegresii CBS 114405]|uniref:Uncharacterized protein n=1 Tax=Cladophialophora yegresii CBS 114405 TaxID=1182544 RepID=W9VUK7_9EURO|nr:uncharacterized protein A1O7_06700 [Cladophialophora yegresii CBS 114405]EXJ59268.1 hypothetical protein A1O7_06700 [Cladophialophora yegresii CBS 114405]